MFFMEVTVKLSMVLVALLFLAQKNVLAGELALETGEAEAEFEIDLGDGEVKSLLPEHISKSVFLTTLFDSPANANVSIVNGKKTWKVNYFEPDLVRLMIFSLKSTMLTPLMIKQCTGQDELRPEDLKELLKPFDVKPPKQLPPPNSIDRFMRVTQEKNKGSKIMFKCPLCSKSNPLTPSLDPATDDMIPKWENLDELLTLAISALRGHLFIDHMPCYPHSWRADERVSRFRKCPAMRIEVTIARGGR
jgi:hypothetical protein